MFLYRQWLPFFLVLVTIFISDPANASFNSEWENFKQQFLMKDGRIIDTGNKNISHSEGQGYSMLFAVAANDKNGFERIWKWTKTTLKNPYLGLFYWRYNPTSPTPITDKNNASDGDLLIAWALLKAGEKWHNPHFLKESDDIVNALVKNNVINFENSTFLLPGYKGFDFNYYINLNPSYFIFPAWKDLRKRTNTEIFNKLIDDADKLLSKKNSEKINLPPDWMSIFKGGEVKPAEQWEPRMSYDAIRVPLYITWYQSDSHLLIPWKEWFSQYPREKVPAWVNVSNGKLANYNMQQGLLAVRDLIMNESFKSNIRISKNDDYYSASLKLLTILARENF